MKKKFILVSGIFSALLFLMVFQTRETKHLFCPSMTDTCIGTLDYMSAFFLLAPVVLVLSLSAYFLSERNFVFWAKSTGVFSVVYFLAVLVIPEDRGGGIMNIFPDARLMALVSIIILYLIVSVIYFLVAVWSAFRNKK